MNCDWARILAWMWREYWIRRASRYFSHRRLGLMAQAEAQMNEWTETPPTPHAAEVEAYLERLNSEVAFRSITPTR